MQGHLSDDVLPLPHLEVRGPHRRFDRAVWVLIGHAAHSQLSGILVQPLLHPLQYVFVLPPSNEALFPPATDGFMADINTTFVQQISGISQRQWKTNVLHHCQANDLGTCFEALERSSPVDDQTLRNRSAMLEPGLSDKALAHFQLEVRCHVTTRTLKLNVPESQLCRQ